MNFNEASFIMTDMLDSDELPSLKQWKKLNFDEKCSMMYSWNESK